MLDNERAIESTEIYTRLREWRKEKAKEKGVDAYIIASNRTLREIAIVLPKTKEQMLRVYGIGEKRYQEADFVEVIEMMENLILPPDELVEWFEYCDKCLPIEKQLPLNFKRDQSNIFWEVDVSKPGAPVLNPVDPHINSPNGDSNCPTCGKPGWDGVHKSHPNSTVQNGYSTDPGQFDILFIEEHDLTDNHIANANGARVLDVEIRGITIEILSKGLDNYLRKKSVGIVFDFQDHSSPFIYRPEWISRPLKPMGGTNTSGFWRCRLSHTIANEEECHLCGGEVRNPNHYLCYSCWKAQNRGDGVA